MSIGRASVLWSQQAPGMAWNSKFASVMAGMTTLGTIHDQAVKALHSTRTGLVYQREKTLRYSSTKHT